MLNYIFSIILLIILSSNLFAQKELLFEHLSVPEGLADPTVLTINQDSYGYLWIGTASGVSRYDGYEFVNYRNDPSDTTTLSWENVWTILEDHTGNLWVGGQNVLALYNRKEDSFIPVELELPDNAQPPLIFRLFQDSQNRIWVGTRLNGVHLLDVKNMKTKKVETTSKQPHIAFSFLESSSGNLLTSDFMQAIQKYNENENKFEVFEFPGREKIVRTLKIFEDEFKRIWIGGFESLNRYDPATNTLQNIDVYKDLNYNPNERGVVSIIQDNNGFLLLGTQNDGLLRYNPVSEEIAHYTSNLNEPRAMQGNATWALFQDNFGILWVGSGVAGLNKSDPNREPLKVYRLSQEIKTNSIQDAITSMVKLEEDDNIWLGTAGLGLIKLNLINGEYKQFEYDPKEKNSLSSNAVRALALDDNNNIWIATDSSLNSLDVKSQVVSTYLRNEFVLTPDYRIFDLKIDETGRIYLATNQGIDIFLPGKGIVRSILTITNRRYENNLYSIMNRKIDSAGPVASILQVGEESDLTEEFSVTEPTKFLIVSGGEGISQAEMYDYGWLEDNRGNVLWAMDEYENTFHLGGGAKNRMAATTIELPKGNYKLRFISDVGHSYGNWNVAAPVDSTLWGIQLLQLNDDEYQLISNILSTQENGNKYLPLERVNFLRFSHKYENILWMGSEDHGLFKYDLDGKSFVQYLDSTNITSPLNDVEYILESQDGTLWFCTDNGLGKLDEKHESITYFTVTDGLANNVVTAIQEDNYGNLWISSAAGLTKMLTEQIGGIETFINIDIKDGLQGYLFSRGTWKSNDGELFFGGSQGFNAFYPGKVNQSLPSIAFSDFKISDQSVSLMGDDSPLTNNINDTEEITLSHDQNNIAFEFAAIHYSRPERNKVAYKLEGFHKDWISNDRRYASFTNLEPGEYLFHIKAANGDGIWNEEERTIAITISSPWWSTTLAYIIYGIVLVLGVITLDRLQKRRLLAKAKQRLLIKESEMRAQLAEAENERKTRELEEARQLQLSMLPRELPQLPNLDIAVYMKTATEVGGDYYDFHVGMDGTLTVVVGDATGHGLKAGTMVTAAKSLFNSHASNPDILFTFNEITRCIKQMQIHMLSMCLTILKVQGNKIKLSAAGMPPTLLYRKNEMAVEEIVLKGMPLGAVNDFPYQLKETTINTGDTLLLQSDGLPELFNDKKEMFSYERAVQEFSKVAHKSPEEIIEELKTAGSNWVDGKEPDDDVTFVVIKVK
ncbi:MAG: SpoIIE family protein phosphatase [Ignavibacterium sp.]|nr:MAG: SpoIIE family protein phosphatase [Ignavibacterium sp.]